MKLLCVLFEFSSLQQWKLPLGRQQMQVPWGFEWLDPVLVSRLRHWKSETLQCPGLLLLVRFFPAFKMNTQTTPTFFTHREKLLSSVKFQNVGVYVLTTDTLFGNFCVLGIIVNLAWPSSQVTSINATTAHFQCDRAKEYELAISNRQ